MFALFDHQIFRIEGFAGGDSRTIDRAAAAFEGRPHVEQLLPRVLLDLRDTERLGVFEILDRSEAAAWTHVPEKQIQRAKDQMAQLCEWETEEQHEYQEHMHQPEPSMICSA